MARTVKTLTAAWQQVSAGACVVQVQDLPARGRTLSLNETATDVGALNDSPKQGDQYAQNEAKATFAKGDGFVIIVDEAG
jgi:hypothetical protein